MPLFPRHDDSMSGMDMGSSTTTASGSMATGMSDSTSSAMSSDDMMSMSSMTMTFFTSTATALFSDSWTPEDGGQYAGTCIFLIFLAVCLRILISLRPILETRFWAARSNGSGNRDEKMAHSGSDGESHRRLSSSSSAAAAAAASRHPRASVALVGRDLASRWSGWSVGTAASRATYELVIAGVGYLLMLAIMTMNVGYFLSVLGGIWLGTFVLGNLSYDDRSDHC